MSETSSADRRMVLPATKGRCSAPAVASEPGPTLPVSEWMYERAQARVDQAGMPPWVFMEIREKLDQIASYGALVTPEVTENVTREVISRVQRQHARIFEVATESRQQASAVVQASVVYFIACGDLIKIGTSVDAEQRIKQMQLPPSAALLGTIQGDRAVERQIHSQFAHLRHNGTEWFTRTPELERFIADALA